MSTKAEKLILKKTYKCSARMQKMLELELKLDGCSSEEISEALKKLTKEGAIYICRTDNWIKKV